MLYKVQVSVSAGHYKALTKLLLDFSPPNSSIFRLTLSCPQLDPSFFSSCPFAAS